ncbi:MAG TPA: tetratricopeptide repeat protein [Xanthobacteraceae bacterium]|jgi:tetratricopeptide (TPR) repeat protein
MRLRIPLIVGCVLVAAAMPALAASQKDHDDCNSDDPDRNIAGCTRVAEDHGESARVRGIAYVGRGLAWATKGDDDRAMADFTAAIRLNPKDSLAYNNRAIAWRDKGNPDRAIADFTQAIRLSALPHSDLPGTGHVNIYSNRGLAWAAKGDLTRALADFDESIRQDRFDPEAYWRRARLYVTKHDLDHAIADMSETIRLDPARADAYLARGLARYDRYMGASAYIKTEDLTGAIADFTVAIRFDPKNANALYARGLAHQIDGDRTHAVADFTEAVRLEPYQQDMRTALKRLVPDNTVANDAVLKALQWPPAE